MKTVTGTAVSSKPISLSKATSTLSSFISADNGGSQAICSYLRRAFASFNELKRLHKDLNSSRSHRHPLEYGKTALPSEFKAEVESSVAAIEMKNKKHKKKSQNGDERDVKSENITTNNGQIEATENLVNGDEKDKDNGNGKDLVEMSTKKKKREKDADSRGAIEKEEMPVSDIKELRRKEKKRKNRDLEEEQQGTKRRKGNL